MSSIISLKTQISIINDDVIGISEKIGYDKYDLVTCNPPYFPAHEASDKNLLEPVAIARHEIYLTLRPSNTIRERAFETRGTSSVCPSTWSFT